MPSTYTTNLGIELPADGELDGVWGDVVNENMDILDRAINGSVALTLSGTTSTLTTSDGALSDGQYKLLVLGGSPSGTHTITIAPNDAQKIYFVRNTTAQSVVFTQGSGGNVTVATGDSAIIYSDGAGAGAAVVNITNDFAMSSVKITGGTIDGAVIGGSSAAAGTFTTVTASGDVTIADKIVHSGDTNTAIRFPAADTVTVETSGVERMRIDSSGNVGIGVTAPTSKLNVVGDQIVVSGTSGTAGLGLQLKGTPIDAIPAAQTQGYIATGNSGIGTAGDLLIAPRTDTTASIRFVVGTTPTERMRIDASGNVYFGNGVNVASPANSFLLATNGSGTDIAGASMTIQAGRGTGAGAGGSLIFNTAAAGTTGTSLNAATERMRITSAGNVGIGTSSPSFPLHVYFAGGAAAQIEGLARADLFLVDAGAGTDLKRRVIRNIDNNLTFGREDDARLNFYADATITSTGNVGIGTTSPAARLDVTSAAANSLQARFGFVSGRGLEVSTAITGGTNDAASILNAKGASSGTLIFQTDSSERMRIDSAGNVGIGTTSPAAKLDVTGEISSTGRHLTAQGVATSGYQFVGDGDSGMYQQASNQLQFSTANTERMRIDSAGKVSVGLVGTGFASIAPANASTSLVMQLGYNATDYSQISTTDFGGALLLGADEGNNKATSYIAMRVDASERMRITAAGNVGIGTTAPAAKLEVALGANGEYMRVGGDDATNNRALRFTSSTTVGSVGALHTINASGSAGVIALATASTERMRIDSSGNVGIGTASPAQRLHVKGVSGSPAIQVETSNGTNNSTQPVLTVGTDTLTYQAQIALVREGTSGLLGWSFLTNAVGSPTERMRITSAGNVVIGNGDTSATPTNGILQATGGSGTDIVGATLAIQGGRGTGSGAGGPIIFSTAAAGTTGTTLNAATERMRISAGGILTVGTTNGTPGSSNVVGAAISGSGYISISRDNISAEFNRIASDGDAVVFQRAGTKVGSISVTTTATAYNTSSDYRLKESIQPIFGASDRVRQLNPVNFAWKADGTRTDGFIAHEVQAVAPQAVTGEKDGEEMQAIDHSKLVPLLTAALQEALTEIAGLKARITALEA